MKKIPVGLLGATGMVGQKFVELLENHPWFSLEFLAASDQSSGKLYREAVANRWHLSTPIPEAVGNVEVHKVSSIESACKRCRFVFSALHGDAAQIFEEEYAKVGLPVFSNASFHRTSPDVPVLIPEVNAEHIDIIPIQQKNRGWERGFIVVKPNCSLQSYVLPLHPLHLRFKVRKISVTTLQAISGAGYPGLSSFDMVDNVVPYIQGEEEKTEQEPLKIWGSLSNGTIVPSTTISISAQCTRVPVRDGHVACVSVQFEKTPSREEILQLWKEFRGEAERLKLPSAPDVPLLYLEDENRPQPYLDRDRGGGMTVSIGRLRPCPLLDWRFVALSHNTVRGAAGGSILNAELLYHKNFI